MREIVSPLDGIRSPFRTARGRFSPLALFAASEPGGWYDPSDLTTLFQDAAGTTPVTAVEQPVGLVLDKSRPITYGSELVSNGTFATNTTGWATSAPSPATMSASVVSGAARLVYGTASGLSGQFSQGISVTAGKSYRITATVTPVTGTVNANISIRDTASSATSANLGFQPISGSGTTSIAFYFHATSTTTVYLSAYFFTTSCTIDLDDVSMREMSGSHLSQSTSTARPVLSARVNLLTYTEQFDNADWAKTNVTVDPDQISSPVGTQTADRMFETSATDSHYLNSTTSMVSGFQYRASVYVKKGTGASARRYCQIRFRGTPFGNTCGTVLDFDTGLISNITGVGTDALDSSSVQSAGNGWYLVTIVNTATVTSASGGLVIVATNSSANDATFPSYAGSTSADIYIWGADLRPANAGVGLPAYQRVGAATDYDAGDQWPKFLKFDGTDDSLSSAAIDFSTTDKMSLFAGVRKLSDAAGFGVIVELSANPVSNNGTFAMHAPRYLSVASSLVFENRGSTATRGTPSYDSVPAPSTFIATATGDITNDITRLRHNGVLRATATDDLGTGNYSNNPIYVGNRPGFLAFFNGHLYSLIVRGAATDAATITATETWVNQRTKAF